MASTAVISALNKSENCILNSFKSIYEFVESHNGNRKVSKKHLIDLLDENIKSIITYIEKQKANDDNINVDSNVNIILKDILRDGLNQIDINGGHSYPNDNMNTESNVEDITETTDSSDERLKFSTLSTDQKVDLIFEEIIEIKSKQMENFGQKNKRTENNTQQKHRNGNSYYRHRRQGQQYQKPYQNRGRNENNYSVPRHPKRNYNQWNADNRPQRRYNARGFDRYRNLNHKPYYNNDRYFTPRTNQIDNYGNVKPYQCQCHNILMPSQYSNGTNSFLGQTQTNQYNPIQSQTLN